MLLLTVVVYFSAAILSEKLFGKAGLYGWIIIGTIMMNIELVKLVDAYAMEMTLGNVLFSSTFLCTDILAEKYGKKESRKGALMGCAAVVSVLVITQIMLAFTPSANDFSQSALEVVYGQIPRLCFASVFTYFVCQLHDVWLYEKIRSLTEKKFGKDKLLWLRNCGSTLVSQAINAVAFTLIAFYGVYDVQTLVSLMLATYIITAVLALLDTPFIYVSKYLVPKGEN